MAGVTIRVEFDDGEVRRALDRLARAGTDLAPTMRDIGEHLLNSTRKRFSDQQSPDGTPWAPLTEKTKARKKRNKDKILTRAGFLRGNLTYRADADSVEIGSPSIYAGTHQFGAPAGSFGNGIPWGDIPARPFLADADGRLAASDEDTIREIIRDHLADSIK